eukprot:c30157_g1_i1 orf=147-329(+)
MSESRLPSPRQSSIVHCPPRPFQKRHAPFHCPAHHCNPTSVYKLSKEFLLKTPPTVTPTT